MIEVPRKIAIDRDDVLIDLCTGLGNFHNERYGTNLTPDDFHTFELDVVWGCDYAEALKRVKEFYQSQHYQETVPIPGAREGVSYLQSQGCELAIVTSTHADALDHLLASCVRYFPDQFGPQNLHLTHEHDDAGPKRKKVEICTEIGASVLIDDYIKNLRGCSEAGVQGILMRRPWNRSFAADELSAQGILPAENWQEVIQHIDQTSLH